MATKYQLMTELYRRESLIVAKSPEAWQTFLTSACRNYKFRFDEQLLIYAQRPEATAVTTLENWNRLGRWVKKNSRGIAVFDGKGRRNTLKYYFDLSDTTEGRHGSRPVPIWQMEKRYEQAVMERLSNQFGGMERETFTAALMETARNAVEDNLVDYLEQLKEGMEGSLLEKTDAQIAKEVYKELIINSVAFMLFYRCGLEKEAQFDPDDFISILYFQTPAMLNAVGIATSDIAEMALREISLSIQEVQMAEVRRNRTVAEMDQSRYDGDRTKTEGSGNYEQNHLHETGRLSYTRPRITNGARTSPWQIRFDAPELPGTAQAGDLPQLADDGKTERISLPDRANSPFQTGNAGETALRGTEGDRRTEGESAHTVDRHDGQYPQSGGGSDPRRADLQLTPQELEPQAKDGWQAEGVSVVQITGGGEQLSIATGEEVRANLPTIDEQMETIEKAEEADSSAFFHLQEAPLSHEEDADFEEKSDRITFSISFSEHPAFYDKQLHDRYTDLNFALGNKLLGILDEKQHRERQDKSKDVGWYKKTDFEISVMIDGEDFHYKGRFDIGDGEGDLIAHIRNFYEYSLSPKCPLISMWKEKGEDYYQEQMEGLHWGRDVFLPFLERHTELTREEEKLLAEIMATEADWNRKRGETESSERSEEYGTVSAIAAEVPAFAPLSIVRRHNYRITNDQLGVGGAKEKFQNNMAAIRLLKELEAGNRLATPGEQEPLSRYVGWGGLSMAFDKQNTAWEEEYRELKSLLPEKEYRAAMESTLTAFYTPPVVIRAMYGILSRLGFTHGKILEPSCGVGNFFGLLPESMAKAELHGIEIDPVSGRIARQLYQKADISICGFEDTEFPDGYFDVVIGNVPFGEFSVNDSYYKGRNFLIHDYFFAKALDKVRSGGVVLFLTSKGTMDKKSPEVRRYLAQRAELLGAIRLPDNTFKANAGTEVTSDILILRKRDRIEELEPDWVSLDTDETSIAINRYFVEHPEMVLGHMVMERTQFGMDTACKARSDMPLSKLLLEAVEEINGEIQERINQVDEISDREKESIPADPNVRNFSFALVDDKIYFRENNQMCPTDMPVTAEGRIRGMIRIRDCVRKLIRYQTEDFPEETIEAEQKTLNRLYDTFTEKYGLINSRGNYLAFASDESYFLICSLEVLDDEGKFKKKADMFTKRTIKPHREVVSVETASEALALSIGEKACVDLEYMAGLTGKSQEEIVQELQGVIFQVPGSEPVRYVAADEYLSGNVREKLKIAEAAAEQDARLSVNVEALRQVIPKDLSAAEITVRLGTTWIPESEIQQFLMDLLTPEGNTAAKLKVHYVPFTNAWFIENKRFDSENVKANSIYGTKRASAYRIIEDTLNLKDTRVFDYEDGKHGNKKATLNGKETMVAQAKQEAIKQAFQDWIWKDPERRNRLIRYYNDTFNAIRPRIYDGSHITLRGISPEITLRPHQLNAVAHILYGGNTLLAHKVGAGKTFEMVAAAQESKRLGLCQKSMFVVPNHLIGQWASEYLRLYPSANILVATKRDFEKENRKKFCGRIATGDYDAVILGHSQFEKIPMSVERRKEQLQSQIDDIESGIKAVRFSEGGRFMVKQLVKTRMKIQTKLRKLNDTRRKDNVINFEELGVDRLFIDESHFYKNLYLYTKMKNVGGIAQTEAQKSSDLFMKCRYLDEITGGRGIVFATGTPISNSMVELYSVQRYLQYDTLEQKGLQHFDAWASTFGETVTALELAPEGTGYRAKTRFAKFNNLPELMQMFREVADIQTADMLKLPVPKVNYHNVKTKPSEIQTEMVRELAARAEEVRTKRVSVNADNMLKITNDGRKLALDQRIINPMLPDEPASKVNACVNNVYRLWEKHVDTRAAQLVFCDLSTPKNEGTFNVYDDIRNKLVRRGIPAEQVRFIHEATTDVQKKGLFAKVRSGEVRVLLGSTQKMGAGTNVQDRLIAIHNLDCPWRPSDLEQRQGRLERQGNMFPEVEVYRYVTEQTFDAYLYQLVEGKQKFISQIMTSKSPMRSAQDVDEVALSFAEVKMLATGDERFKEKMDLDIQISRLRVLKQSYFSEHYDLENKILNYFPKLIQECESLIIRYEDDMALAERHKPQGPDHFYPMVLRGRTYTEKAEAGAMLLAVCEESPVLKSQKIGSYRGFDMEIYRGSFSSDNLSLCGKGTYTLELGVNALKNIARMEGELAKLPSYLEHAKKKRREVIKQFETAKEEMQKPFAFEKELKEKMERLNALNIELNLDEKDLVVLDKTSEPETEPSEKKERRQER